MGNFLAELKRRHMFRVAAAYAVVAWLILQVVNNVAPALRLPEWAATLVLVLLLVGFPITLLAAWARELAAHDGPTERFGASKLDYVLIGALGLVIALLSYQQLALPSAISTAQQVSVVGSPSPQAQGSGISIAVLPFVNLSDDRAQEFFSDGMTEEITTALAKVQGYRDRPHIGVRVQGTEPGFAHDRPSPRRDSSDRGLGAQGGRARAHRGSARSRG